jgi:RNA polymerase sigma-70 factor (ECF subfamily)
MLTQGMQPDGSPTPPAQADDAALRALLREAATPPPRCDSAWKQLLGIYGKRVFGLARSRLGGDRDAAEDIVQSVFSKLAVKLRAGEYVEEGKFEAYLFRVAMNRIRDEGRRRSRSREFVTNLEATRNSGEQVEPPVADPLSGSPADHAARRTQEQHEHNLLREALAQLPEADREVIELRHHGGMSFQQLSLVLEEPIGTILARHHRALRKLRAILDGKLSLEQTGGSLS